MRASRPCPCGCGRVAVAVADIGFFDDGLTVSLTFEEAKPHA